MCREHHEAVGIGADYVDGPVPLTKVVVVGAGGVGASVAFNLLLLRTAREVVLIDRRPEMVSSHVMDLEQTLVLGAGHGVRAGEPSDAADADVLVVTAAAPLTLNTSRHVYLGDNAAILGGVLDALPAGWGGVLVLVTNPVDPLCTWAQRRTGIDRRRVLGYTLNDSLRLRTGLSAELAVEPASVEAWVIGEHGDASVPLWDRVTVDGVRVEPTGEQAAAVEEYQRSWYALHVALDSGRTSTWTSGLGVARMVAAIANNSGELWPASLVLAGEYGVNGVALSVPVRLGRGGAERIEEWALTGEQARALTAAASVVREAVSSIEPA
jgi:malate dehydrogenase